MIEADVRELSDFETQEIRLIENIHRADLTDAEKGDGFLALFLSEDCPYKIQKDLAEKLQLNYNTIGQWTRQAKRLSPKIKEELTMCAHGFSNFHAHWLLKYPHNIQDKLAKISIQKNLTSRQLQELTKRYDANPQAELDNIANEILGLPKTVTIPVSALTEEQKQTIQKEKQNKPKPVQPKTTASGDSEKENYQIENSLKEAEKSGVSVVSGVNSKPEKSALGESNIEYEQKNYSLKIKDLPPNKIEKCWTCDGQEAKWQIDNYINGEFQGTSYNCNDCLRNHTIPDYKAQGAKIDWVAPEPTEGAP